MKLFWKFFFSFMTVILVLYSIGSYALIETNYQSALNREIESTYKQNDIIYSLFVYNCSYVQANNINDSLSLSLSYQITNTDIPFQIETDTKQIVTYEDFNKQDTNELKNKLEANQRGYMIIREDGHYYLHCIRKVEYNDENYYICNYSKIDDVFSNTYYQLNIYSFLVLIAFAICTLVIMVVSWWLTKPIKQLSVATKAIGEQDFNVELPVDSRDEIGDLSRNFLIMKNQIQDYIHQLEQYNQSQDLFIGNFTHELKTPLTSIIGYADMLRSKKVSEQELILSANQIFQEGKRLESISKKLMDLIVLKKHNFTFIEVNTLDFFDNIKDTVFPVIADNIEVIFDIEEDYIYIERDLMKTVCLNLIDNAKNAIDVRGQITITGKKESHGYKICISDNGKGISQSDINRINEAFYMVDKSRTRAHGGAGLGLALVDQIVKLHGSQLQFKSELDVGTDAYFVLGGHSHD